jgi:hypothetical protein
MYYNRLLWLKLSFCILLIVKGWEILVTKRFGPKYVQERIMVSELLPTAS